MTDKTTQIDKLHHRIKANLVRGSSLNFAKLISEPGRQAWIDELLRLRRDLKMLNEQLLRARHEAKTALWRYKEIYDDAIVGYLTLDRQGVIQEINGAALQLFGAKQESLLKKSLNAFVDRDSQDVYNLLYQYVCETGQRRACELRLLREDGSFYHAALECRPLPDNEYSGTSLLIAISDISERIAARAKLQETSMVLKVIIKQREEDRMEMESNVLSNINRSVVPYIDKLRQTHLTEDQSQYLKFIQTNLENVVSPFVQRLLNRYDDFTPREIEIANLVKNGRKTKDIADLLSISCRSVEFHKNNIRKKIGLRNKKMNLQVFLISFNQLPAQSRSDYQF